jgi:hypothetical protein
MPLELGLFLGAKRYGDRKQKLKVCKILDIEAHRFQKFCSDLGGQDIYAHGGNPKKAISIVRDWLRSIKPRVSIPSGSTIGQRYDQFQDDLPILCETLYLEVEELTFIDFQNMTDEWLHANPW